MRRAPKVPPLLVLGVAAGTAWLIDRMAGPSLTTPGFQVAGAVVASLGVAVALGGVVEFRRAQTTVDPIHPDKASALVVRGIYRVTRNPMYLGFALLLGGWVLALASLPGIIVTVSFFLYLNHFQIPPEEAALSVRFGEAFDYYKARVRRWL